MSDKIICWFSGGITSAVACKLAIDKYGKENCIVIMQDTMNEHEDTYRFIKDCEKWYGLKIQMTMNEDYESIQDCWRKHKSLNVATGSICSYKLKRVVRERIEKTIDYKHQVFGFEYHNREINRAKAMKLNYPKTNPIFPLIENKMSKIDCINFVESNGIKKPKAYELGFNNNNCLKTGCIQGGIGYWQKIQRDSPDKFEAMANMEHELTEAKGQQVTMLKDQAKPTIKRKPNETEEETRLRKQSMLDALLFLKPHPDYPQNTHIGQKKGREPKPLVDCMGFCGIDDLLKNEPEQEDLASPYFAFY